VLYPRRCAAKDAGRPWCHDDFFFPLTLQLRDETFASAIRRRRCVDEIYAAVDGLVKRARDPVVYSAHEPRLPKRKTDFRNFPAVRPTL